MLLAPPVTGTALKWVVTLMVWIESLTCIAIPTGAQDAIVRFGTILMNGMMQFAHFALGTTRVMFNKNTQFILASEFRAVPIERRRRT